VGGPAGERVHPRPGEAVRGRSGQGRADSPGRCRWRRRSLAGLGQGGRDQGAGEPGQQQRGVGVEAVETAVHLLADAPSSAVYAGR
jgi:hypothetical protein